MMPGVQSKQRIKRSIALASGFIGGGLSRRLSVILNYHSVHPAHETSTRPEDFTRQMEYLKTHFNVMCLSEFHARRAAGEELPGKVAMITFDDGYRDNYDYAFPVLERLGLPATIFVTTGFVNGEIDITRKHPAYRGLDHLDWPQLKEMREHGIFFGAHTHTHPVLTEVRLDEAEKEIILSKQLLEEKVGGQVRHFAFPFGQPRTFNASIIALLKKHDFELACSAIWGSDNSRMGCHSLCRIRIDACDSFNDYIGKVNGEWDFIKWFQLLKG